MAFLAAGQEAGEVFLLLEIRVDPRRRFAAHHGLSQSVEAGRWFQPLALLMPRSTGLPARAG